MFAILTLFCLNSTELDYSKLSTMNEEWGSLIEVQLD